MKTPHGFSDLIAGSQIDGDREYQEDSYDSWCDGSTEEGSQLLLVLADGMGGHLGGAEASKLAIEHFIIHFEKAHGDPLNRMQESLYVANQAVGDAAAESGRFANMGCTLLACLIAGDEICWVSVGDSPLWELHDGELKRLNKDHSMRPVLEKLVESGDMTQEDLARDGRVHQLRSAIMGEEEIAMVDVGEPLKLKPNSLIILASDGLEVLTDDEIIGICESHEVANKAVSELLHAVEKKAVPRQDNATVMLYRHVEHTCIKHRFEDLKATTKPQNPGSPSSSNHAESEKQPSTLP